MKIPEKVKIGGIVYDIKFQQLPCENDHNVDGQIIYDKQEIRIKPGKPENYEAVLFLHEVIHGIFDYCCLKQDERQVDLLAKVLYQVIKDNDLQF